jgi:hypothetical protein
MVTLKAFGSGSVIVVDSGCVAVGEEGVAGSRGRLCIEVVGVCSDADCSEGRGGVSRSRGVSVVDVTAVAMAASPSLLLTLAADNSCGC